MFGFGRKKEQLNKVRVAILVADGVEQTQLDAAVKQLRGAGADVYLVGRRPGKVQALRSLKQGDKIPLDVTLEDVHPASFGALLILGGTVHADRLRLDDRALEFVRSFDRNGKPIAALGHGLWVLLSAGILTGRTVTSWPGIQHDIRNAGAEWRDEPYVLDENLLTGRTTNDLRAFTKQLNKHFTKLAQEIPSV